MKLCDQNLKETLELTEMMIKLAVRGDTHREDSSCGILYGILLDSAYKIKKLVEEEINTHKKKGWYEETTSL